MSDASPKPLNILFILTDQERRFDSYPESVKRPGLERMQRMGVTFENHHICSAVCTPSRSTIYTAQHIVRTGMFDNTNFPWQQDMSTEIPTVGDRLRDGGYYTAYKGKWHLTEEFHQEIEEGMQALSLEEYGFSDFQGIGDIIGMQHGGYRFDTVVGGSAVTWLRGKGEECRERSQPWFLAVNLVNPHDVMFFDTDEDDTVQSDSAGVDIAKAPPHRMYRRSAGVPLPENWNQSLDEPGRPVCHKNYMQVHDMMVGHIPPDDEERWKRYQDYYFNCLQDVDVQLGRLLDELEALELLEDTVIIYTSDHGELASAHGLRGKGGCAYAEQNNVPLIIAHPDFAGGARCKAITSHIDLLPTVIGSSRLPEAVKARIGDGLPGYDLTPLLEEAEAAEYDAARPAALFAYNMFVYLDPDFVADVIRARKAGEEPTARPDVENIRGAIRSIVDGRYRYSRYFAPRKHNRPETLEEILQHNDIELFDLHADPHENHNLALEPERHRALIEEMNAKMNAVIDREIGEDIGQMLPHVDDVGWAVDRFDTVDRFDL